jgi:hypothetical protein
MKNLLSIPARHACAILVLLLTSICRFSQGSDTCPHYPMGSSIVPPQDLFRRNGVLCVNFTYRTRVDPDGSSRFCFMTEKGSQSPTLHVRPGDRLLIELTNAVPPAATSSAMTLAGMRELVASGMPSSVCGAVTMTPSSVNVHYHGTNTGPTCHQDEVIRTVINSGETFRYDVQFPAEEPPGLY